MYKLVIAEPQWAAYQDGFREQLGPAWTVDIARDMRELPDLLPGADALLALLNVLLILADDLGWGDLGCYGNRWIKTPALDKLAREGTLFSQFYVANPVCSPSRTAFMTGHFPPRHGIHALWPRSGQSLYFTAKNKLWRAPGVFRPEPLAARVDYDTATRWPA